MTQLSNPPSDKVRSALSPARQNAIVFALVVATFTEIFETTMIYQAIPHLAAEFKAPLTSIGWLVIAFLLAAGVSAVIGGRLGDIFGRRRLLLIVLAAAIAGSVISLAFGTLPALIVGRTLQGLTGAAIPLAIALARDTLPPLKSPIAISIIAASSVGAGALGLVISGILVDVGGWRLIFALSIGLALLAFVLCLTIVPFRPVDLGGAARPKVDIVGAVLLTPGVALALLAVTSISSQGFLSTAVLAPLGVAVILLVAFVLWELRTEQPLIDLRLVVRGRVGLIMLATVFLGIGPFALMSLLTPLIYQSPSSAPIGLGLTASFSGIFGGIGGLLAWGLSPVIGRLIRRRGAATVILFAASVAIVATLALLFLNKSVVAVVIVGLLLTLSQAMLLASIPNILVAAVPQSRTASVTGSNYLLRSLFNGVGTAIATAILASSVVPGTTLPTAGAFDATLGLLLATWVAVGIIVYFIRRSERSAAAVTESPVASADLEPKRP